MFPDCGGSWRCRPQTPRGRIRARPQRHQAGRRRRAALEALASACSGTSACPHPALGEAWPVPSEAAADREGEEEEEELEKEEAGKKLKPEAGLSM